MRLSVIIPTYNESAQIAHTLSEVARYLSTQPYEWEIIVADDGSTDTTVTTVRQQFPDLRLVSYHPNRGKGFAVKQGLEAAQGDIRLFSDADLSTPIEEIEKFWPLLTAGADVVIGSRDMAGSQVEIHQAWYRESMGKVFNFILRALGITRFPDTQCGFKAYTALACDIILPRQTVDGFGFDAEQLFIAEKHGLRVEQVPVRWINCARSSVNPIVDSTRMLWDACSIRIKDRLGKYN